MILKHWCAVKGSCAYAPNCYIKGLHFITPNIALRSGSLNLNGIFDTCKRFGVVKDAFLLMSWWWLTPPNDGDTMTHAGEGTSAPGWLQSSPWKVKDFYTSMIRQHLSSIGHNICALCRLRQINKRCWLTTPPLSDEAFRSDFEGSPFWNRKVWHKLCVIFMPGKSYIVMVYPWTYGVDSHRTIISF